MKTTRLFATIALTGLMAIAGSVSADGSPHDIYNKAFFGDSGSRQSEAVGKAAWGTPSGHIAAVDAHDAYYRAFYGRSSMATQAAPLGKAAFGTALSIDAHSAYEKVFRGD